MSKSSSQEIKLITLWCVPFHLKFFVLVSLAIAERHKIFNRFFFFFSVIYLHYIVPCSLVWLGGRFERIFFEFYRTKRGFEDHGKMVKETNYLTILLVEKIKEHSGYKCHWNLMHKNWNKIRIMDWCLGVICLTRKADWGILN